jgi:hypothetical protein
MNRGMWLGLLVISMATAAPAEIYYVATDGSDENRTIRICARTQTPCTVFDSPERLSRQMKSPAGNS